jgi:hypothetical protein
MLSGMRTIGFSFGWSENSGAAFVPTWELTTHSVAVCSGSPTLERSAIQATPQRSAGSSRGRERYARSKRLLFTKGYELLNALSVRMVS